MTVKYIDLNRTFAPIKGDEEVSAEALDVWGRRAFGAISWPELLAIPRIVVLAEAGSGKTREFQERAAALAAEDKDAFFAPIEQVAEVGFRKALGPTRWSAFNAWKASSRPGWVFLDSVDEAKLQKHSFGAALAEVADHLADAAERAMVLVSCRGTDWDGARDLKLFDDHLPAPAERSDEENVDADQALLAPLDREGRPSREKSTASAGRISVFSMTTLTRAQQRAFLVGRKVEDIEAFEAAVNLRGLSPLTQRPGDLSMLVSYWRSSGQFGTLTEMTEAHVRARLRERPERADADLLNDLEAREAAERLAAAMTLAHTLVLKAQDLDEDGGDVGVEALDPADLLPALNPNQRAALLRRAIFSPATFGRSRFHHRSAVEFLTASWFRRLHTQERLSESAILSVFTRRQYGVATVPPSLRPAAAWLAPHCPALMQFMLRHTPLSLIAFGDPAALPLPARVELLARYAALDAAGDVAHQVVDHHALWMFGDIRLAAAIRAAWDANDNADFRFDLLRLIELGAIAGLEDLVRQAALDETTTRHNRIVAAQALVRTADAAGMKMLTDRMLANPIAYGPRLAPELTATLFPAALNAAQVVRLMGATPPARPYQVEGFGYVLEALFAQCPDRDSRMTLVNGVSNLCFRPPAEAHETISKRHTQLSKRIGGLARQAVLASDQDDISPALVRLLQVAERADVDRGREDDEPSLAALVRDRRELNQALFRADVKRALKDHPGDRERPGVWLLRAMGQLWKLDATDAQWLETDVLKRKDLAERRLTLAALFDVLRDDETADATLDGLAGRFAGEPELAADLKSHRAPRKASPLSRRWDRRNEKIRRRAAAEKARTGQEWRQLRQRLQAQPSLLSDPARLAEWPGPWELLLLTRWLGWSTGLDLTKAPTEYRRLEPAFGVEVAEVYRQGMASIWQLVAPARPTIDPNGLRTTKHTTVLAMGGLNLLAQEPPWLKSLGRRDAARVTDFICLGDQDIPEWLNSLLVTWPTIAGRKILAEIEREWPQGQENYGPFLNRAEQTLELVPALRAGLLALIANGEPAHLARLSSTERILHRAVLSPLEREEMMSLAMARLGGHRKPGDWAWRLSYISLIFELDVSAGVAQLAKGLASEPAKERKTRAEAAFGALFGHSHGSVRGLRTASVATLATLLRLAYEHIQPNEDHYREGGFSPDRRDDAESGRNRVLSALMEKGGEEAYRAILQMVEDDLVGARAHRFNQIARQVADADADRPGWSAPDVLQFEGQAVGPVKTGGDLLDLACDMIDDIALRFTEHDYSSRAVLETARDEIAVQNYLAEQLEFRAKGRCLVSREKQVIDDTRPDISLSSTSAAVEVAIEIKHGEKGWSLPTLRDALHRQLSGDYLRAPQRRHGLLVITNHRAARFWQDSEGGTRMSFAEVIARLQDEATTIVENPVHRITVRVRGLDASSRKPSTTSSASHRLRRRATV